MSKHIFRNVCINFEEILTDSNVKRMIRVVKEQAGTEEALNRTKFGSGKPYDVDEWSPLYFGMFFEWLCENFLNYFGFLYDIDKVEMVDSEGSSAEDYGVDGFGLSMSNKTINKNIPILPKKGSKIYIQVKGTLNFNKSYKANDGSRLSNFVSNAMSSAIINGTAYQSRYILFTSGKEIHYSLNKMMNSLMEIINIEIIERRMNNNIRFLNFLRTDVGLPELEYPESDKDQEALYNEDYFKSMYLFPKK